MQLRMRKLWLGLGGCWLAGWATLAAADYEAGVTAALLGNYDKAFAEFTLAAEQGLDLAQYNLGILYYTGQGTQRDYDLAFKWTELAAEQGHLGAQYNLAALYLDGHGTRRNPAQALQWYEAAAAAQHGPSQLAAAELLWSGTDVERDLVRAHVWASFALANQTEEAADLVADIESDMTPTQISEARRTYARMKIAL